MRIFDLFCFKYNRTDFHELNLDWIISDLRTLAETLQNFINLNTIKYANPIQWNITTQYEANTVVIDANDGTAYLSVKPVPSGVAITNTDYWTPIFTLNLLSANQNITLRDDGSNVLATFASNADDWLIWNATLYKVSQPIAINEAYVVGYNLDRYSVELFIKDYIDAINNEITSIENNIDTITNTTLPAINSDIQSLKDKISYIVNPKMYGAAGDGVTDDTDSINAMFTDAANNGYTVDLENLTYGISDTVHVKSCETLKNSATLLALSNFDTTHYMVELSDNTAQSGFVDAADANRYININVDGNSIANYGIKTNNLTQANVYLQVTDILHTGVNVNACVEVDFNIVAKNENCIGVYGLYTEDSDNYYDRVVIVNYITCIYNKGYNAYNLVHVWMSHLIQTFNNTDNYPNTVGFLSDSNCDIYALYADTVHTGIKSSVGGVRGFIHVGSYWHYNNNGQVNPQDYAVGGVITDFHTCFDLTGSIHAVIDSICTMRDYYYPLLYIASNFDNISINDSGYGLSNYFNSSTFSNSDNSFYVINSTHPAYSYMPEELQNANAGSIEITKVSNSLYAKAGADIWLCSWYGNRNVMWYSIGKPTSKYSWHKISENGGYIYKTYTATLSSNSQSYTGYTASYNIASDIAIYGEPISISAYNDYDIPCVCSRHSGGNAITIAGNPAGSSNNVTIVVCYKSN